MYSRFTGQRRQRLRGKGTLAQECFSAPMTRVAWARGALSGRMGGRHGHCFGARTRKRTAPCIAKALPSERWRLPWRSVYGSKHGGWKTAPSGCDQDLVGAERGPPQDLALPFRPVVLGCVAGAAPQRACLPDDPSGIWPKVQRNRGERPSAGCDSQREVLRSSERSIAIAKEKYAIAKVLE